MKYRISRRADNDIERICDRIAANNPNAAERLDERLHHAMQLLGRFPGMGHARKDVKDDRYLFWAVGDYVIAYRVEGNAILVVRVLHGAQTFGDSSSQGHRPNRRLSVGRRIPGVLLPVSDGGSAMKQHFRAILLTIAVLAVGRAEEPRTAGLPLARSLGHDKPVWSMAFNPNGSTLASVCDDNTLTLWDLVGGKEPGTLKSGGSCLSFSPDGKTLATGDKIIKLWDLASGKERGTLVGSESNWALAFSPDGKTLAAACQNGAVVLWDVAGGKERAKLRGHTECLRCVAFSPDGTTLASGGHDNAIRLWDMPTGKERAALSGHRSVILALAFTPDGKTLASGSDDQAIKLWDMATNRERATLKGHTQYVASLAFSPDGKTLASGSADQTLMLWETATAQERACINGHYEMVMCVAFHPRGTMLASGSRDSTVKLWEWSSGRKPEKAPVKRLSPEDADGYWAMLDRDDAAQAFRAMNALVLAPEEAVDVIRRRLPPVSKAAMERVAGLIANLDDDQYAVRLKARQELETLGEPATPALRKALAANPSLEVRVQLEKLLARREPSVPHSPRDRGAGTHPHSRSQASSGSAGERGEWLPPHAGSPGVAGSHGALTGIDDPAPHGAGFMKAHTLS